MTRRPLRYSFDSRAPDDLHRSGAARSPVEGIVFACKKNELPSSDKGAHVCLTCSGWQLIEGATSRLSELLPLHGWTSRQPYFRQWALQRLAEYGLGRSLSASGHCLADDAFLAQSQERAVVARLLKEA